MVDRGQIGPTIMYDVYHVGEGGDSSGDGSGGNDDNGVSGSGGGVGGEGKPTCGPILFTGTLSTGLAL